MSRPKPKPPEEARKCFFRYERGPKGWVPKIYWDDKPVEKAPSKGDPPNHSETWDVTHISRLYKPTSTMHLFEELTATYPAPEPVIKKDPPNGEDSPPRN